MSTIKRWDFVGGDGPGAYPQEEPDGRMVAYTDHVAELAALREELAITEELLKPANDSYMEWRKRAEAAEQRNAELYGFLERMFKGCGSDRLAAWQSEMEMVLTDAALKPTESVRQYYYRVDACKALNTTDPECKCWHDEGTGPLFNNPLTNTEPQSWRPKPTKPTKPAPVGPKICIECEQPYCHGVCVERGDDKEPNE